MTASRSAGWMIKHPSECGKTENASAELDIDNHEGHVGPMTWTPWEYIRCLSRDTKSYDMEDINLQKELNFKLHT